MKYISNSLTDTLEIAKKIKKLNSKVIILNGQLGSGKTTFVKKYSKLLGEKELITSPTYQIVKEYNNLIHFDLYRISSEEELFDIGFLDYLKSDKTIFIEWPEVCIDLLDEYLNIEIEVKEDKRIFRVK